MKSFNIGVVARGSLSETSGFAERDARRYAVPQAKGCFKCASYPTPPFSLLCADAVCGSSASRWQLPRRRYPVKRHRCTLGEHACARQQVHIVSISHPLCGRAAGPCMAATGTGLCPPRRGPQRGLP